MYVTEPDRMIEMHPYLIHIKMDSVNAFSLQWGFKECMRNIKGELPVQKFSVTKMKLYI